MVLQQWWEQSAAAAVVTVMGGGWSAKKRQGGISVAGAKRDDSSGDGDGKRMYPKGGAGWTIEQAADGDVVGPQPGRDSYHGR